MMVEKKRMSLGAVRSGRIVSPERIWLYGPEGGGKSTWASDSDKPIFLCAEAGTKKLDIDRLPQPDQWADVLDATDLLAREQHDYRTFVVDTLDWVEQILHRHVATRNKVTSIQDLDYGAGYTEAMGEWRKLIVALDALVTRKNMHVILLGHSFVEKYNNPRGPDYDRFAPVLHKGKAQASASDLFRQWVDFLLFATHDVAIMKESKWAPSKAVGVDRRFVYTTGSAAFAAKRRDHLPDQLPMDFGAFWEALQRSGGAEGLVELVQQASERAKIVRDEAKRNAIFDYLGRPGLTAQAVRQAMARIDALVIQQDDAAAAGQQQAPAADGDAVTTNDQVVQ